MPKNMRKTDYQLLLDHLDAALIQITVDLRFAYLNSAAEMLLETSSARLAGKRIVHILGQDSELIKLVRKVLFEGQRLTRREVALSMEGGREAVANLTLTPLSDGRGILLEIHSVGRFYEITQEAVRQEEYAATRSLLRGLAHEIKNPLGGIRGAAQLLEAECTHPELKSCTEIIVKETDRLRRLIDRMVGPRQVNSDKPISIHEVTERVVQLIQAEAPPEIRIKRDYDPSIPDLRGDLDQLIQAALNLARNALEALAEAGQGGVITFSTRIIRNYTIAGRQESLVVRLRIADNGPGVAKDLKNQLFFPLISSKANGSGLGLSLAQAIINAHRGIIKFDSAPGNTSFDILLPL